jgi:hypothetical protein
VEVVVTGVVVVTAVVVAAVGEKGWKWPGITWRS